MTRQELTSRIKAKALALGFTKVGVTTAAPFDEAADRFEAWIKDGAHGVMKWMERDHDVRSGIVDVFNALHLNPEQGAIDDRERIAERARRHGAADGDCNEQAREAEHQEQL